MSSRIVKAPCFLVLLALSACGETRAPNPADDWKAAQGGAPDTLGSAGQAGTAGAAPKTPPSEIAGRWAMFFFEDPVGIQVTEADGTLTGLGCASGTPPLQEPNLDYCGDVHGTVQANQASFDFKFDRYDYIANTTVSADAQRMTGRFHGAVDWLPYPTAWLRVSEGKEGLPGRDPSDPPEESGDYDLRLSNADPGATEYVPNTVYSLYYSYRGSLSGDLGCFWDAEITRPNADGPIQVGPVPLTDPALPVSMSIEVNEKRLTQFSVVTGSGHSYTFSAVPTPIPPPSP
jgi:hypothetical protein